MRFIGRLERDSRFWTSGTRARTLALQTASCSSKQPWKEGDPGYDQFYKLAVDVLAVTPYGFQRMIKRGSVGVPWQLNPTPGGRGRKSEWRGAGSVGVFGRKSRERQARRWVRRLTMTWISDMRKGQKSSIHKMLAPLIQFPWKCCKKALLLRVSALPTDDQEGYIHATSWGTCHSSRCP